MAINLSFVWRFSFLLHPQNWWIAWFKSKNKIIFVTVIKSTSNGRDEVMEWICPLKQCSLLEWKEKEKDESEWMLNSVTRRWNKQLPNVTLYCPKSSHYIKVVLSKIVQKGKIIFGLLLQENLLHKKFKKSPNLVTLLCWRENECAGETIVGKNRHLICQGVNVMKLFGKI